MKPLVFHASGAEHVFGIGCAVWVGAELVLAARTRRRGGGVADPSYAVSLVAIAAGLALAVRGAAVRQTAFPGGAWWPVVAGAAVFWAVLRFARGRSGRSDASSRSSSPCSRVTG